MNKGLCQIVIIGIIIIYALIKATNWMFSRLFLPLLQRKWDYFILLRVSMLWPFKKKFWEATETDVGDSYWRRLCKVETSRCILIAASVSSSKICHQPRFLVAFNVGNELVRHQYIIRPVDDIKTMWQMSQNCYLTLSIPDHANP